MRTKSTAMNGEGTASPGMLELRVAQGPADWGIAHQMLEEEHLLGAGREAGDRLCQFVLEEGQPVAVLVWCAAAWHLKDRDERIGWDAVTLPLHPMDFGQAGSVSVRKLDNTESSRLPV